MRGTQRNVWWLILGITGLSGLAWFMNTIPPDSMSQIIEFLLIILVTSFVSAQFLLNNVRRAVLVSVGFSIFLVLRYLGLRDPIYLILLVASLISLEMLLSKK